MNKITNPEIVGFVTLDAHDLPFHLDELKSLLAYRDTVLLEDIYDPFAVDDAQLPEHVHRWVCELCDEMERLDPDLCYVRIIPENNVPPTEKCPEFGTTWTDESVAQFCSDVVRTITQGTLRSWEARHFLALIQKTR